MSELLRNSVSDLHKNSIKVDKNKSQKNAPDVNAIISNIFEIFDEIIKKIDAKGIERNNSIHIYNVDKTIDFMIDVIKYEKIKSIYLKYYEEYEMNNILNAESKFGINLQTHINQIINYTEKFITYKVPYKAQLQNCLNSYKLENDNNPSNLVNTIVKYNICCNKVMKNDNTNNELRCEVCSRSIPDAESYYEDLNNEKNKTKYESSKHCKDWLMQIQAKNILNNKNLESDKIKIEDMLRKKKILVETKTGFMFIPCNKFRETLKDLKLAIYNNHIPYMRKLITGYIPEQLTPKEEEKIVYIFELCENAYDEINKKIQTKNNKNPNTPYYPYFIYKILEIVLPPGRKLDSILECIHIQSDATLFNHDNNWRQICEMVPFLKDKFKPTNKYKQLNF